MDTDDNLQQLTDLELVAAINRGDEAAFTALYHRHRDWIVSLAYRWTGDRDLALDVLQETFFILAKRFPGFSLTAKLQTFLYPIIRNLSINTRQKSKRYHLDESQAHLAPVSEPGGPAPGSDEALRAALATLGQERRDVLLLRFVDGLSMAEIADVMGIPVGTVKSRLHNALEALRQDKRTREFFEP
jgi:RNA polymerase sigma-70 factor, ECF subfamily